MKIQDLLEQLRRVPKRDHDNPHPLSKDPDSGWIYDDDIVNATAVVKDILGNTVTTDENDLKPGMYLLSRTWGPEAMFSNMDMAPGLGGAIGLEDLNGKSPVDIAQAAHEAYHAKLHSHYKNADNEHVVNRLAIRWLQDHLSGKFLHFATEEILRSKRSYKGKEYPASRKWLADYNAKFGKE